MSFADPTGAEADRTPFLAGLRAVVGNPRLLFRELLWRWCFGAVALAVCATSLSGPIRSVQISGLQRLNLHSENAFVVVQTMKDILEQLLPRITSELLGVAPVLAILWVLAATAGHSFSFRLLCEDSKPNWRSTLTVHMLRVVWALLVVAGLVAAGTFSAMLAFRFNPDSPSYAVYYVSLAAAGLAIWSIANVGNWYLTLAPLFTVVEGAEVRSALRSSRQLSSCFAGPLAATTLMFFFVRLVWFGAVGVFSMAPVGLLDSSPGAAAILLILLALIYCAGADFLQIARMAAYWHIVRRPPAADQPPDSGAALHSATPLRY